ncbi:MAG: GspH/FimT family pseudopilin [Granulosicoccus sp.]
MSSVHIQQCGLTLIEMMVALVIAAILLAVAVPSLQSLVGDSEMTATSNELVFSLQTARSEAIKRAEPVALCPSANSMADEPVCGDDYRDGWIVFVDNDANGTRGSDDTLLRQVEKRSAGFVISADEVFKKQVSFDATGASINPSGVPLSGQIALDYKSGAEKRSIAIKANGRIASIANE